MLIAMLLPWLLHYHWLWCQSSLVTYPARRHWCSMLHVFSDGAPANLFGDVSEALCTDATPCVQDHPISNVWAVGAPYILLYYIVSRFLWAKLGSTMYISLAPWDIWPFLW